MGRIQKTTKLLAFVAALAACSFAPLAPVSQIDQTPWAVSSGDGIKAQVWSHYKLPNKSASRFEYVIQDGRHAIAATARSSASMLRQKVLIKGMDISTLKFSWKLPNLIQYADMSLREFDDSPVRIVLAFEGDRAKFSGKNAMLSELAQLLTVSLCPMQR